MKFHLAWIRVTAAAAIVASTGVHPAAAQYAPYRPIPQTPPAPAAAAPAVAPPTTPYVAYRPQPYQQPVAQYQAPTAPVAQYQAPAAQYQAPTARYQAPAAAYQAPVAQYQQPAAQYQQPAAQYQQPVTPYPQTTAQYPAGGAYAYVAQATPTEALPTPSQSSSPGPGNGNGQVGNGQAGNGQAMPTAEGMPADPVAPAAGGNCAGGGYPASTGNYTAAGCGCNGSYPEVSQCMGDTCNDTQWFGGVYFLYMARTNPSDARLTTEIETGTVPYPYYPPASSVVVSSQSVDTGYQPGVEIRLGSTFTVGESCNTCQNSCGYSGCGGCQSCRQPTTYAWEVAWWGLDNDTNEYVRQDDVNTRMYGMKSFAGLEYDRDGAGGAYAYRPVNDYYDYQMPIQAPPGSPPNGYTSVLAQRVYTNFQAQNLELNVLRFPLMCDSCNTGCGGSSCGGDSCGCGSNYTGCNSGCGCDDGWNTSFSMYGSCGVRYFRTDDDFAYDSEFTEWVGGAPDQANYNGFTYDNSNEICYDINIDNNLIGPQVGWTTNYGIGCRWNFFCNSTFGVFDNHINQTQRMWTGGDGVIRFAGTGESFEVRSNKDNVAFLGELRVGGSYDVNCHCRLVLAYRALGLTGIATSVGQMPDQFSSRAEIAQINSDSSMIIHGVQTGVECRY